jgi:hypothetical protein
MGYNNLLPKDELMKTIILIFTLSSALSLLIPSCTSSSEDDWCFDEHLLFPIGTEWTYNFYSNEFGDLGSVIYKATKCTTISNQKWIITEQIAPSDWMWEFNSWEYSLVDSVFFRRYVSLNPPSPRGRPERYFLNDAINHPDTLEWTNKQRVVTIKLGYYDSLHVNRITYKDVYYHLFEIHYNPTDTNWTNYYSEKYFMWFAPGIGVIKVEHYLNEGQGDPEFDYIDIKELISYKYTRGYK